MLTKNTKQNKTNNEDFGLCVIKLTRFITEYY